MATVMKTTREVKGVGLSIPRADGAEKVTGKTEYVADLKPKGMLHAKLLRSPHAHAWIKRIDTSRAKALPGVRAVVVAADIPGLKKKAPTRAHAVLAIDRVVFVGQPVAAVAADELAIAEEACDLIQVDYEVLPAAVDPLDAMKVGAPPVAEAGTEADTSEALAHSGVAAAKSEVKPSKAVNISQQAKISRGDLAKAFAESDVVIEKTYRIPMVHQGYLEPHAVLAQWDQQGQLTLWASTQGSFNTRSEVADILGLEENQIKVIPMECGGGFGGKIRALCEPITAVLAKATGRPVRYVMTRREELDAGNPAPQVIIKLKTGCKRDGTLMALDADTIIESGAFSGRRADHERRVHRQRVQVPQLRGPRLRGADAQAQHRRLSRADGAPHVLRHRLADGADGPGARRRRGRVPDAPPDAGRRSDGQRPEVAVATAPSRCWRASPSIRCGRTARRGRRRAARTVAVSAAPGWRWAAGFPACSRPAPPCG